jgi:hypothetical protein
VEGATRTFGITDQEAEFAPGAELEFLFRVGERFTARDLNAPGADPDPRNIGPWRIGLEAPIVQRGGVTIFNNVIDPNADQKTLISYSIESAGTVNVTVFSLDGQIVRSLHNGVQGPGEYFYSWDGRNMSGEIVARGLYYIRVFGPDLDEFRRVLVVK